MASNAPAYAMIMWNQFNNDGTTVFITTNVGFDEAAFDELESRGVITSLNKFLGKVQFNPDQAKRYLKLN